MSQPRRVFRLMGRDTVMTPADGAFLNQLVIWAGGVPMAPPGEGMVTPVSLKQWQQFNPEVVFGCGEDRQAADRFFHRPGWRKVDAVQNGQVHYFPCELTCRVGPHTGYFVQWLAATIYGAQFFTPENQVRPDQLLDDKPLPIDLDSIQNSRIHTSRIADFTHKTLVIDFKTPQTILSTLEGFSTGITTAANHYLPPPAWQMAHAMSIPSLQARILDTLEKNPSSSALLMTGADMNHVTVTTKSFKEMTVFAAVTAGVGSNAQRAGKSTGSYYEPGTINIILMTNMALSPRAMTRSLIAATEAKTAALADLDIRSSDDPALWQATGTGTDNILVVQGTGQKIDGAGGHTKMGELIARAVHEGVTRAVFLQNGLTPGRSVFQRLAERGISVHTLTDGVDCQCSFHPGTTLTG
ncbi:MAG: adenosylcobinamide amidohydrolase, partial [Desulfobacteraceae bacterium]|nr:adenosylcobinamide amidohydrolase [Desulfobacteraceae bacterium]